jgi:hypothetical protein
MNFIQGIKFILLIMVLLFAFYTVFKVVSLYI